MKEGPSQEGGLKELQLPEPLTHAQIENRSYETLTAYLSQIGLKHIPHEQSAINFVHWLENARDGVSDRESANENYLKRVRKILDLEAKYVGTEQLLGQQNKRLNTIIGLVCDPKGTFYLLATDKETGRTKTFAIPRDN